MLIADADEPGYCMLDDAGLALAPLLASVGAEVEQGEVVRGASGIRHLHHAPPLKRPHAAAQICDLSEPVRHHSGGCIQISNQITKPRVYR